MTSSIFFFLFVPLLAFILLAINFIFAPHNPYQEKNGAFECGFTSFLGQNRTQFSISFFIFALLFLLFDLEILLVYPYLVSSYINESYGLVLLLIFLLALTLGFVFELGKKALTIDSRQTIHNKSTNLYINKAMIVSFQDIMKNVISYIIGYIYNEIISYLYLALKFYMETLLDCLINFFVIRRSLTNKQLLIMCLSIDVILKCFVTLLYSSYYGCVNEYVYILLTSFITVAILLYITFSKNFKVKHPIIHKYLEIFLIISMMILSFYLLFNLLFINYYVKGNSKGTKASGGKNSGGNRGGKGGGPNEPKDPFGANNPHDNRDSNENENEYGDKNPYSLDSEDDKAEIKGIKKLLKLYKKLGNKKNIPDKKAKKAAYDRIYREKNRERISEYYRKRHENNKEFDNEYYREYRKRNSERISEHRKEDYKNNNREHICKRNRNYYENNRERINQRRRDRRKPQK